MVASRCERGTLRAMLYIFLTSFIVYRPNMRAKSDADILRDAKLEAMGMPPQDDSPQRSNQERTQMATDEIVCSTSSHFIPLT